MAIVIAYKPPQLLCLFPNEPWWNGSDSFKYVFNFIPARVLPSLFRGLILQLNLLCRKQMVNTDLHAN